MTVTEFESYLEKGLGRAILLLRQEPDKAPFREAVLQYVCRGYSAHYMMDFDLDLLASFDDRETVEKEAAARMLKAIREETGEWNEPLLKALGYQKEVTLLLKAAYQKAWEAVRNHAENDEPSPEWHSARNLYRGAVYNLLCGGDPTQDDVRAILPDLIAFYSVTGKQGIHYHDTRTIRYYMSFPWQHDTEALKTEITALEGGADLWKQMSQWDPIPPDAGIRAETVLSYLPLWRSAPNSPAAEVSRNFCAASLAFAESSVVQEVAEYALSTSDLETQDSLFFLFLIEKKPALFPYPERLLSLMTEENLLLLERPPREEDPESIRKINRLFRILRLLAYLRHPQVAILGKRLRRSQSTSYIGWQMMMRNYNAEDRDELLAALTEESPQYQEPFYSALRTLFFATEEGHSDLPLSRLPDLWDQIYGASDRFELAKVLLRFDLMSENIKDECRYDRNPDIRNLIKEHYDSI